MENPEKNIEEVRNNTPQIFSANELIGLDQDDEDWFIYERRYRKRLLIFKRNYVFLLPILLLGRIIVWEEKNYLKQVKENVKFVWKLN